MKLNLPVLQKDDSWEEHSNKLFEECKELDKEIWDKSNDITERTEEEKSLSIAEETLDVIEVCIGILDKLEQDNKGIVEKANLNHVRKLVERGWQFKAVLEIRED